MPESASKQSSAGYGLMAKARETGHITITKHFIGIPTKSIHITMLVLLKVDFSNINLFFAFRNKIRYFNTTCDTFLRGTLGNSELVFRKNFSFINVFLHFFDNYHLEFGMRKIIWRKNLMKNIIKFIFYCLISDVTDS